MLSIKTDLPDAWMTFDTIWLTANHCCYDFSNLALYWLYWLNKNQKNRSWSYFNENMFSCACVNCPHRRPRLAVVDLEESEYEGQSLVISCHQESNIRDWRSCSWGDLSQVPAQFQLEDSWNDFQEQLGMISFHVLSTYEVIFFKKRSLV